VKGMVIANCGAMGLDWERLSMSGYLEACGARDPDRSTETEPTPRFKRFATAHGVIGHA